MGDQILAPEEYEDAEDYEDYAEEEVEEAVEDIALATKQFKQRFRWALHEQGVLQNCTPVKWKQTIVDYLLFIVLIMIIILILTIMILTFIFPIQIQMPEF